MIKTHLEEAVRKIEYDRERAIQIERDRVTREEILPYNQEIDKARDAAIAQRQGAMNEQIRSHQEAFSKERQEFIDGADRKKKEHAEMVLNSAVAVVSAEYDKHIGKLKALAFSVTVIRNEVAFGKDQGCVGVFAVKTEISDNNEKNVISAFLYLVDYRHSTFWDRLIFKYKSAFFHT
jgi:hypothetical protein